MTSFRRCRQQIGSDSVHDDTQVLANDNRPKLPDRFGSIEHARSVGQDLFTWYNDAHHHSGLTYLTLADVHHGRAAATLAIRHCTRLAAYVAHPERFVQAPRASRPFHIRFGSIRPRKRPVRMPQERRSSPRTTRSMEGSEATTLLRRFLDVDDQLDGVATVSAESGCLKGVDTAWIEGHHLWREFLGVSQRMILFQNLLQTVAQHLDALAQRTVFSKLLT